MTPSKGRRSHLNVFNLTSSQASRLFQVVNREDFDQSFKSVVIELNKRFSNSWQSQGSYTWQDSQAFGGGAVTGSTQQDFSNLSSTPDSVATRTTSSTPSDRRRPTRRTR